MSASHSKHVIQGIREDSSVSEIISAIRHSFQEEEYDEAERVMMNREKKLRAELNDHKKEYASLKEACDSVTESYGRASLEKLQAVEELLECKTQLKESSRQLNMLNLTIEELRDAASSPSARCKRVPVESKMVKLEWDANVPKLTEELANKDDELKKVKSERDAKVAKLAEELANKDDKLMKVKSERDAKVAKLTEELANKDEELKKATSERDAKVAKLIEELVSKDEELNKVKGEKETIAEMLANKDREINQLKIEKNGQLKDIVARVHFLNEDIINTLGVDAMRRTRAHYQGTPLETLPTIVGESGDQNFPKSGSSSNACGAENANLPLEGDHPNGKDVLTSTQSSSHLNVGETDALNRGKSPAAGAPSTHVPLANQASKPLEIIDITSDNEDESMSDSDDSLLLLSNGKQPMENTAADTDQSKRGSTWFDDFMEAERAKNANEE